MRPRAPSNPVRVAALTLALALVTACGGVPVADGEPPEDVDAALLEGLKLAASATAELPWQRLRYNPAAEACGCPAFEVRVGESWWRVRLEPDGPADVDPVVALRADAEADPGPGRVWYAVGRLDDDPLVVCPNGSYGFEMSVVSVSDEPPTATVPAP